MSQEDVIASAVTTESQGVADANVGMIPNPSMQWAVNRLREFDINVKFSALEADRKLFELGVQIKCTLQVEWLCG